MKLKALTICILSSGIILSGSSSYAMNPEPNNELLQKYALSTGNFKDFKDLVVEYRSDGDTKGFADAYTQKLLKDVPQNSNLRTSPKQCYETVDNFKKTYYKFQSDRPSEDASIVIPRWWWSDITVPATIVHDVTQQITQNLLYVADGQDGKYKISCDSNAELANGIAFTGTILLDGYQYYMSSDNPQ